MTEHRRATGEQATIAGVNVREEDIEPVKGIRAAAILFRGMAVLLVVLMIAQVASALSGTVPMSMGVLVAEAVRLVIFAGLLWGAGDLAVLFVKSHYDLRATRILTARVEYLLKQGAAEGRVPGSGDGSGAGHG